MDQRVPLVVGNDFGCRILLAAEAPSLAVEKAMKISPLPLPPKATHAADTDRHGPRKTLQLIKQEPGIGPPLAEIALHKNAHLIAAGFLRQSTPVRPKSPRKLTYTAEWRSVSRARPKSSNPARPASFADHCRWPQHSASNIHPVDRRRFYGKV